MDVLTRKYINELAQRVMDVYHIGTPIPDMKEIVYRLGGVVEEKIDFDDLCDGTIQKIGENNFEIVISPFQNNQRKTFTIAHELGHLFLHMGFLTDRECWGRQNQTVYRRFGTTEQEYQANEFAAALLMPEKEFKKILDTYSNGNYVDMNKVSNYFNVSVSAAVNRGKFLGYLAWED